MSTAHDFTDPGPGADVRTTVTEEFLATDARFFAELGVPNDQPGWTDSTTGPATITIESQEVFGTIRDVVKHFDNGSGIVSSTFALDAQDWIQLNANGGAYGGTDRLDSINGGNGFFTGLQANAAENPLATGNRRYGITFANNGGFLKATLAEGGVITFDGTLGNPRVLFDEFFKWEVVVPVGLGAAKFFVKNVETSLTPTFAVNSGGLRHTRFGR